MPNHQPWQHQLEREQRLHSSGLQLLGCTKDLHWHILLDCHHERPRHKISSSSRSMSEDSMLMKVCFQFLGRCQMCLIANCDIDKWANQIASDNADSYKIQLPSDIAPGTYVLRAELIALHGNHNELRSANLKGEIQFYPYCFNIEIRGSGTATPEGVTFPGAYEKNSTSFTFPPFSTYGNNTAGATEHNAKYVRTSCPSDL